MQVKTNEPWFCFLECACGYTRTQNLEEENDTCDNCNLKMYVVNTYPASDY